MKLDWIAGSMCALLLGGCGVPKSVGELEDSGEDSSGDDSSSDSTSGGSASSGGGTTTSASGSGTASSTESNGTSDSEGGDSTTGGPICMEEPCGIPPELEVGAAEWTLDGGGFPSRAIVGAACTVGDVTEDAGELVIVLQCGELEEHVLRMPSNSVTPLFLTEGTPVILDFQFETPFWINTWFSLRTTDDVLLVAGVSSSSLLPAANVFFFAPISLESHDGPCLPDCGVAECGVDQRLALGVAIGDDAPVEVQDGSMEIFGELSSYAILLERATRFIENDPPECADIPSGWYQAVIYNAGEG